MESQPTQSACEICGGETELGHVGNGLVCASCASIGTIEKAHDVHLYKYPGYIFELVNAQGRCLVMRVSDEAAPTALAEVEQRLVAALERRSLGLSDGFSVVD